jgi:hypothetical protein
MDHPFPVTTTWTTSTAFLLYTKVFGFFGWEAVASIPVGESGGRCWHTRYDVFLLLHPLHLKAAAAASPNIFLPTNLHSCAGLK